MRQKNNVELESELISRLNHERELFVQKIADCSKSGIIEGEKHANLMESIISAVDHVLNHAGSSADGMMALRELRDNAVNLLTQLDQQNAFDDTFEADADPI